MTRRIAACLGLIAFATCLVQGLLAENSFQTVIWRALQALVVTLVVGLTIGVMLEKMLSENLESRGRWKIQRRSPKALADDRNETGLLAGRKRASAFFHRPDRSQT